MADEDEIITYNDERVYKLVRLALASEYNKKGLKREDILDKVDTTMRKVPTFNKVLQMANQKLKEDFAFELVPLPVISSTTISAAKTNQSRRAAVNQRAKAENSRTGPPQMFCLVSTLTQQQRAIIPRTCRDKVRLAILHSILMIIKLSGNSIEHQHLIASLNDIHIFLVDSSKFALKDLDPFLEQLKKERYIMKEKKNITDSESIYSWGPRAYVEFPPKNISEFLLKVASTNNKEEIEPKFKEKILKVLEQTHIN